MSKKTCFVIIGYGKKTDYPTGRSIDLDKSYEYIIKPVFEELGFLCFRSCDLKHSGVIDIPMYESIIKSDFVLADITTLNPNVLYELGIRHSVKKNTTLIISDKELTYPFDLSHINIDTYEHLGNAIDYAEVNRFKELIRSKVVRLLDNPAVDSPLYSLFPTLNIPSFTEEQVEEIEDNIDEADSSLSDILELAELAKNQKDYSKAISYLNRALTLKQDNILVIQRLALATYKSQSPNTVDALLAALAILEPLNPTKTTDIETLGLCGAINKRLFDEVKSDQYLDMALKFYEKGFYISEDYYNGINAAFIYNIKAVNCSDKYEAFGYWGNAVTIRKKVKGICEALIGDSSFHARNDKEWILLTLAEANYGLQDMANEQKILEDVPYLSDFSRDSYQTQKDKLSELIAVFNQKFM